ncbi:MAG: hypothetical protein HY843_01865 [Bdellovibrio sp.]|nr:hypothetical protein [Bdellovibrio sp.]
MKNRHACALGKLGGIAKSKAKREAVRLNGRLGGRPRSSMARNTAHAAMCDVMSGEDWSIAYMDFVDRFRKYPSYHLIKQEPPRKNKKMYALLQSICIELLQEADIPLHGWVCKNSYLKSPWFVSGMKSFYAMAIVGSPVAFRKNNIFVIDNFLERV